MKKIVVLGSTNTDMVIAGKKIPVPGETVCGGSFLMNPGGKGANQAVAVARLSAKKGAVSFELAEREGNFNTFMLAHEPTPVKGRVFSLRILHGKSPKDASYRYEISLAK